MAQLRQLTSPRGVAPAWIVCLCLLAGTAGAAPPLRERIPPEKPSHTRLEFGDDPERIVVKFAEGSALRSIAAAQRVVREADVPLRAIRPLFPLPEERLDAQREVGQRRGGRTLADLNLYYEIEVPASADAALVCDALNALPAVELALPGLLPAPPPTDLPPMTPDFVDGQDYRDAAPVGVDAAGAARIHGANGANVTIVDVEYQWVLDHEDLELGPAANIDTATLYDPFPLDQGNHGTAVLGVLGGLLNPYGVVGIAHAATLLVAPASTVQYGYNPGRAIALAAEVLAPGDVILIEQQLWACAEQRFGPLEWYPPWFDAIASATSQGILVVEAAGNGNLDLDGASCSGWFDRTVRDSGAIVVGAGFRDGHSRFFTSSYGSRVDVQGWADDVWTTGYGVGLFNPGDVRQRYTRYFGQTSAASAIVAGVVAAVQGAAIEHGLGPLEPAAMRDLLVSTGTPQLGTEHIGPLPDITAALAALGIHAATGATCGLTGIEALAVLLLLGRLRRRG